MPVVFWYNIFILIFFKVAILIDGGLPIGLILFGIRNNTNNFKRIEFLVFDTFLYLIIKISIKKIFLANTYLFKI